MRVGSSRMLQRQWTRLRIGIYGPHAGQGSGAPEHCGFRREGSRPLRTCPRRRRRRGILGSAADDGPSVSRVLRTRMRLTWAGWRCGRARHRAAPQSTLPASARRGRGHYHRPERAASPGGSPVDLDQVRTLLGPGVRDMAAEISDHTRIVVGSALADVPGDSRVWQSGRATFTRMSPLRRAPHQGLPGRSPGRAQNHSFPFRARRRFWRLSGYLR